MSVVILLAAIVVLLVAVALLFKAKNTSADKSAVPPLLQDENRQLQIALAKLEERIAGLCADREKMERLLLEERQRNDGIANALNQQLIAEKSNAAKSEEALKAQRQRLMEQEESIKEIQRKFQLEFQQIASRLLEEKSNKFLETNKQHLDIILGPLKENIKSFEEKVDKVYSMESAERHTLKGIITQLMELNQMISNEAQNLTKALKGDNKKQGNWGELILERVLERSGLVRDREYRMQVSLLGEDGSRLQPDVVIDLPDEKHIVIDSKVSLLAYERLVNCETEDERKLFSKSHIDSIRGHIIGLSAKNYHDLYQINSPDFVLLFIPIESSFSFAVQLDAELFSFAWEKRVVIVSPSTLLATLRTISSIWKQERQNRNVLEIARLSGVMYDKFVGFIGDMESIGKNIRQGQLAYENAINKLTDGNGNLTRTAEKIKHLGAKANKQIDQKYLEEE